MKVIVNASNLTVGGGVQVAISFILTLKSYTQHQFLVTASTKIFKQINTFNLGENVELQEVNYGLKNFIKGDPTLKNIENNFSPQAVFSVFGPTYWTPKSKHLMGFALPWLINPESVAFSLLSTKSQLKKRLQNGLKTYFTKKNTSFFVVETDDVKNRLNQYLGADKAKIFVADNTYNQFFAQAKVAENKVSDVFNLVTISANYPHKNLKIIKSVIEEAQRRSLKLRFTLTIPKEDYNQLFTGLEDYVETLGPIPANQCPEVYNNGNALFLPTILECFTASYPEAMKMERPILTSNLGFAKAICKDAALYFNPLDPKDICDKIEELMVSPDLRNDLVAKGKKRVTEFLSQEERANKYIECIETIVNQ